MEDERYMGAMEWPKQKQPLISVWYRVSQFLVVPESLTWD